MASCLRSCCQNITTLLGTSLRHSPATVAQLVESSPWEVELGLSRAKVGAAGRPCRWDRLLYTYCGLAHYDDALLLGTELQPCQRLVDAFFQCLPTPEHALPQFGSHEAVQDDSSLATSQHRDQWRSMSASYLRHWLRKWKQPYVPPVDQHRPFWVAVAHAFGSTPACCAYAEPCSVRGRVLEWQNL